MSALLPDLKQQCQGRWSSVLVSLGMEQRLFNGRHQDCVMCGDQRKNARWVKEREFFICSKCGSHSAIDLAIDYLGRPFRDTAHEIRKIMGTVKMEAIKTNDDTEKNRARIEKIRKGLKPIKGECAASRYLANRGLRVLPEKDVYFHPGIDYYQDGVKTGTFPAMVAFFRNLEGNGATMHITYLTPDGQKARVESPKKVLPVILPLPGCSIQMFQPVDGVLAVAEGIETALSVMQIDGVPCWASGNANNMAAMAIPDSVNTLFIYADEDKTFTGARAAYALANRMVVKGIKVSVMRIFDNTPLLDKGSNTDFLDICVQAMSQRSGRNARSLLTA